jgi:hypothetical protein
MPGRERGYKVIRREEGEHDRVVTFANTASLNHMLRWCEEEGYKVFSWDVGKTAEDLDFIHTIVLRVNKD